MKKLIFLFAFLTSALVIQAQVIKDYGPGFKICLSDDTIGVNKSQVVDVKADNSIEAGVYTTTKKYKLDYDDFGYSSVYAFRDFLWALTLQNYNYLYSFDGSGQMDTTFNLIGTDTVSFRLGVSNTKYGAAQPW